MASFVSSNDLSAVRQEKRQARQKVLEEEKQKYLRKEEAKRKHKESGNDKWILPGIESRLEADASKLKPHKKKHKKQKKKKKRKKSSSEDSDSDEEQWEEKLVEAKTNPEETRNWMNFDDVINEKNTYTSNFKKEKPEDEKKESPDQNTEIGQHPNELNPYWKDGGEGLPPEKIKKSEKTKTNKIHKEWLLKSLKRMNEQAEEQDRSIESIATERYGSWKEFQRLLRESDPRSEKGRHQERPRTKRDKKETFMQPRDDDYDHRSRHSHHKRKDEKDKFRRPRNDDSYDRPHSQRKERYDKKDNFIRPGDEEDYGTRKDRDYSSSKKSGRSHRPSWKKDKSKAESVKESPSMDHSSAQENGSKMLNDDNKKHNHTPQIDADDTSEKEELARKDLKAVKVPHVPPVNPTVLTEKEKNQLAAKILKAELMGNDKLANTLKSRLEKAREVEANSNKTTKSTQQSSEQPSSSSESSDEETVVLTRTGKDGQSWPIEHSSMAYDSVPKKRRKKTKVPTHREGERERYFADDDRHSLQDLVRREKTEEAEDQNAMFSRLASKQFQGTDSEYFTLDDMYVSEASKKTTRTEDEARQKQKAISDHKKLARRLEKCRLCFGNPELPKHLLIAIGKKAYLSLPDHKPLSTGHCIIVPMHHCTTGTGVDEDVWDELRRFMRTLQTMFKSQDMDCVFMQTCIGLKKSRHFFIDCIPMPVEEGEMAPVYFKKAIQESESEWSHNKKLIDTRGKDVRNCIPKGLPYFSVEFGMDGGFAHVVEDETLFPFYFGREVVGGMLDVEPRLWRHPPKDHFTEQTKRSLQFSEWWKPHDWTVNMTSTS